jgi:hypothetical protein
MLGPKLAPSKTNVHEEIFQLRVIIGCGARYPQRCPVEFGVPMEVLIAA